MTKNEVMKLVVMFARAHRVYLQGSQSPLQSVERFEAMQRAETELLAGLERFAQERVRQAVAQVSEADARAVEEFEAEGTRSERPKPLRDLLIMSQDGEIRAVAWLEHQIVSKVMAHCAEHGLRASSIEACEDAAGSTKLRVYFVPREWGEEKEALSVREAADISPVGDGRERAGRAAGRCPHRG